MKISYQGLEHFCSNTESNFQNSLKSSDSTIVKIREIDILLADSFEVIKGVSTISETFFLHKSRSLFISAPRIGLGGQSPDVYPLLRAMLESALYSWFIKQDPERFTIWINRINGGIQRSKARNLFLIGTILTEFERTHPKMGKVVRETYELLIDFGAHPSVSGVISGMMIVDEEKHTEIRLSLMHDWKKDSYHSAIKEVARTGVGVLEIFRLMFPEKFILAGLDLKIQRVMNGL